MALAEEHAGRGEVAGLEGGREPANTLVLGDDVPQPALRDVVQSVERSGRRPRWSGRAPTSRNACSSWLRRSA